MMEADLIDNIDKNRLCIGCGVCASVCPKGNVTMILREDGCFSPVKTSGNCPASCGICRKVCPFALDAPTEDELSRGCFGYINGISHKTECGYYLGTYVGHCADTEARLNSASGGLVTWILKHLLEKGLIDRAICVTRGGSGNFLFSYNVLDSSELLRGAAKSAYYPVELSQVLRTALTVDARYAVVCLPCVAKAIRLAQSRFPVLRDRISVILGLVCGHGANAHFADYAASLAGAPSGSVKEVVFRTKDPSSPASELGTLVRWTAANGDIAEKTVYWSEGLNKAWSGHWFTPTACLYCDDAFAETADASFMDAWLADYETDYRGQSIVITRSELSDRVLKQGIADGSLVAGLLSVEDTIRSQQGVVDFKRGRLPYRLWMLGKRRKMVPRRRVRPGRAANWHTEMLWRAEVERAQNGWRQWRNAGSVKEFIETMSGMAGTPPFSIRMRRAASRVLRGTMRGSGAKNL